jgi:hypothetical protein
MQTRTSTRNTHSRTRRLRRAALRRLHDACLRALMLAAAVAVERRLGRALASGSAVRPLRPATG